MPDRPFKVIDGNGEIDPDLTPIPTEMAELVELLIETRAKLSAEKRKNAKLVAVDADEEAIGEVLAHWKRVCRNDHPRVQIKTYGARWKVVKARLLDGRSVEQLCAVCDAAAAFPFEQYGRRYSEDAPGRTRRDDLGYLLRDEERIERMLETRVPEELKAYRRFVHERCKADPSLVAVLASLGKLEPHGAVLARAVVWARGQEAGGGLHA